MAKIIVEIDVRENLTLDRFEAIRSYTRFCFSRNQYPLMGELEIRKFYIELDEKDRHTFQAN